MHGSLRAVESNCKHISFKSNYCHTKFKYLKLIQMFDVQQAFCILAHFAYTCRLSGAVALDVGFPSGLTGNF